MDFFTYELSICGSKSLLCDLLFSDVETTEYFIFISWVYIFKVLKYNSKARVRSSRGPLGY